MSAPNGATTPTRSSEVSIATPARKRKRADSEEDQSNGLVSAGCAPYIPELGTFLANVLTILKSQDTVPSILNHPFTPSQSTELSSEPSAKRNKTSDALEQTTIATKITQRTYSTTNEFLTDVERVSEYLIGASSPEQHPFLNGSSHTCQPPSSTENVQLITSILAFKQALDKLILRETLQTSKSAGYGKHGATTLGDGTIATNGLLHEVPEFDDRNISQSRTVLTLYGNAPTPKQLFSSLQEPAKPLSPAFRNIAGHSASLPQSLAKSNTLQVIPPLRERGLPNGISTTKVIASQTPGSPSSEDRKQVPTLGDLFRPPPSLAPLHPPKHPIHSVSKGSSVTWQNPAVAEKGTKSSRRSSYSVQSLSTGQWLTYNTPFATASPPSPGARRKQRDRAFSKDEHNPIIPHETSVVQQEANKTTLFRRAYSSFAPSRDNAAAVVPDGTKSRLWWGTTGERRFERLFARTEVSSDPNHTQTFQITSPTDLVEDADLHQAVKSYVAQDLPPELVSAKNKGDQTLGSNEEMEQVLSDISGLLETLDSHRRIRNLSLAGNSRSGMSNNSPLVALTGSPASPSSAEFNVFEMLKSQLTILIASLPPYAVAKLNGKQLEELNISAAIPVEARDYRGVMDEEEKVGKVKAAALSAATTTPARTSTPVVAGISSQTQHQAPQNATNPHPHRMGHLPQPSASKPQGAQNGAAQYYPTQYSTLRTSSSGSQRPNASTPQAYHANQPTSSKAQHSAYPQQAYSHQTARPSQSHYGSSNPQQYFQQSNQSNQYNYAYNQQHSQSRAENMSQPQASDRQYQQPSQPKYQQRAQSHARESNLNPTPSVPATARSASPQKMSSYSSQQIQQPSQAQLQAYSQQQRSLYSTPVQVTPRQLQQPNQGSQQNPPSQYQGTSTPSASGFHTYMSASEQTSMLERQRALLAQQNEHIQQAKAAAQANMLRQSSGTPQPHTTQQGYPIQVNGGVQGITNGDTQLVAGDGA